MLVGVLVLLALLFVRMWWRQRSRWGRLLWAALFVTLAVIFARSAIQAPAAS
jgi:hypothetical protein